MYVKGSTNMFICTVVTNESSFGENVMIHILLWLSLTVTRWLPGVNNPMTQDKLSAIVWFFAYIYN